MINYFHKVQGIIKQSNRDPNEHRIVINKLNTFHKHNLVDIIAVYSKEYAGVDDESLSCLNIAQFDEERVIFTYARGVKDEAEIVIDTPYDFLTYEISTKINNFADYFEQLSIHASGKLGRFYKQVNAIKYPTSSFFGFILFVLIILPFIVTFTMSVTDFFNPLFSLMFLGSEPKTVWKISWILSVVVLVVHIAEFFALKIPQKWHYYRVPTDLKVEHFFFCMLEGFPHHQRFDSLVQNVKNSGFYSLDIETADNVI